MKRLPAMVVISLLFAHSGFCQTCPPAALAATKDPIGLGFVEKALATMGTAAGYQDSIANGTLTMSETKEAIPIQIKSKGLTEYRHDLQPAAGTFTYIVDGLDACIVGPDGSKAQGVFQNSRGRGADHIPALSLLARYLESGVQVQYAGTAAVNGSVADVIALSYTPLSEPDPNRSFAVSQRLFFVDRSSGYVTKMQFNQVGENVQDGTIKTEIYFSDYRNVSGLAVPFRQTTYLEGELHSELVLSSVTLNSGLSDADFALSCEATNAK